MRNSRFYFFLIIALANSSSWGQQVPSIPQNAQIGAIINWQQEINFIENKTPWVFWLTSPEDNKSPSDRIILDTKQLEVESSLWENQDFIFPQQ
jgi:hypothetical protein